jgi:serine/threonine protein kinase/tetratricopeptide (TPR) repeat protein
MTQRRDAEQHQRLATGAATPPPDRADDASAETLLSPDQLQSLHGLPAGETISWMVPQGPAGDWKEAKLALRGQPRRPSSGDHQGSAPTQNHPTTGMQRVLSVGSTGEQESGGIDTASATADLGKRDLPPMSTGMLPRLLPSETEEAPSSGFLSKFGGEEDDPFSSIDAPPTFPGQSVGPSKAFPARPSQSAPPPHRAELAPAEEGDDMDPSDAFVGMGMYESLIEAPASPAPASMERVDARDRGEIDDERGTMPLRAVSSSSDDAFTMPRNSESAPGLAAISRSHPSLPEDTSSRGGEEGTETLAVDPNAPLSDPAGPKDDSLIDADSAATLDAPPEVRPTSQQNRLLKLNQTDSAGNEPTMVDTAAGTARAADLKGGGGNETMVRPMEGVDIDMSSFEDRHSFEATLLKKQGSGKGKAVMAISTSQVDAMSLEADFVLRRMIGRGGQGEVWRAWQSSLHREVAVKRMISGDLTEFLQEAYTSAELDHPNIVPVHELGRALEHDHEVPLLAMKLVRGVPWNAQLASDRNSVDFSLEIFLAKHLAILVDVCNAVAYAHAKKIIHRDLKPQQVMVGDFGEVYLMDWGLAICVDDKVEFVPREGISKHQTLDTAINRCGSPAYMAPEQTQESTAGLGYHTDVYLLGAIMYELAGGRPPHFAKTAMDAYQRAIINECEPLPDDCPGYLRDLIERCLATNAEDRPATVKELRESIEDYLSGADRQRESVQVVEEVGLAVDTFGEENLGYEQLTMMEQRLGQALQLWPKNPKALALRLRLLHLHAEQALNAMDLQLARSMALTLPDSPRKGKLLQEVMRVEVERDKLQDNTRQKRNYLVFSVILVFLAVVLVAVMTIRQAEHTVEQAATEADLKRDALRLSIQRRLNALRTAENKLADELDRAAPLPRTLDRSAILSATSGVSDREATYESLMKRRWDLAQERKQLSQSILVEAEPFTLVLGEGNVAVNYAAAQASARTAAESRDQFLAAYDYYREAARLRSEEPEALIGMGVAASLAGFPTSATTHLEFAARMTEEVRGAAHPDTALAYSLAADAFAALGDDAKSQELYRKSLDVVKPQWARLSLTMARYSNKVGDRDGATDFALLVAKNQDAFPADERSSIAAETALPAALGLLSTGKHREAAELLKSVVAAQRAAKADDATPDPAPADEAAAVAALGKALGHLGDSAAERVLALKAWRLWSAHAGLKSSEALAAANAYLAASHPIPADASPADAALRAAAILASVRSIREGSLAAPAVSRADLLGDETRAGWFAQDEAAVDAIYKLGGTPRRDVARAVVLRSTALAALLELPEKDPIRERFLAPRTWGLGLQRDVQALPPPPADLWPDKSQPIETAKLAAWLDGVAKAPDWTAEFPGLAWGLDAIPPTGAELEALVDAAVAGK